MMAKTVNKRHITVGKGGRTVRSGTRIIGVGHYVPSRCVTNAELEQRLDLAPGWIEKRTGVGERRFAAPDEAVSDLGLEAAKLALADAHCQAGALSLLILATSTPDHLLPPTAPLLAHKLGSRAAAMDLAGACSGFVYAFTLADAFLRCHGGTALIVGANILSRRINLDDRASSVLFGDGAGAVVLKADVSQAQRKRADDGQDDVVAEGSIVGLLGNYLGSRGEHYGLIKLPAGGSREMFTAETKIADCKIQLSDGRAAFNVAIRSMIETSNKALHDAGLTIVDIDYWIPHQANQRIIEAAGSKLGIGMDKTLFTIKRWGNSSAATIPLTLSHYWQQKHFKSGDKILMSAVGAGFTEAAIVFQL